MSTPTMAKAAVRSGDPRGKKITALTFISVFALVLGLGAALTATRAAAVFEAITETGKPGYLVLGTDSATPLWATLGPGDSMQWLVQASLHDAARADLAVELQVADALPDAGGLIAHVTACDGSYELGSTPLCHGSETNVIESSALAALAPQTGPVTLTELRHESPRELLVTLSLPANAQVSEDAAQLARVGLGVHVMGEDPPPVSPPTSTEVAPVLARTGSLTRWDLISLGCVAIGMIGVASGMALWRRAAR